MGRGRSFGRLAVVAVTLTVGCSSPSTEGSIVDYRAEDLGTGAAVDLADLSRVLKIG